MTYDVVRPALSVKLDKQVMTYSEMKEEKGNGSGTAIVDSDSARLGCFPASLSLLLAKPCLLVYLSF